MIQFNTSLELLTHLIAGNTIVSKATKSRFKMLGDTLRDVDGLREDIDINGPTTWEGPDFGLVSEIWQYLLTGNVIINKKTRVFFYLSYGVLRSSATEKFTEAVESFSNPLDWEKSNITPPTEFKK